MDLSWIKDLDYKKHFSAEYNDMIDLIGLDNFLKLLDHFSKTTVYFTEKPIQSLHGEFIKKHPDIPAKEIARQLNVSERFVYDMRKSVPPKNLELFGEKI